MRKTFFLTCLLLGMFLALSAQTFVEKCSSGQFLRYNILDDKHSVEVDGISCGNPAFDVLPGDYRYSSKLAIPSSVTYRGQRYSVVKIADYAFSHAKLARVTIPRSVTTIGTFAFSNCQKLHSIQIPSSVTNIGEGIFEANNLGSIRVEKGNPAYDSRNDCNAIIETATNRLIAGCLRTVIPGTVTAIGERAFLGMPLDAIDIPNSVTVIEHGAFAHCKQLTSVSIPSSVSSIAPWSFAHCPNLKSITVNPANPVYDSRDNCNAIIETAHNSLIVGCTGTVIPRTITSIGEDAFSGSLLVSADIPDSVTFIGECAFFSCKELVEVHMPRSLDSVAYGTFWNCRKLVTAILPNSVKTIGLRAFHKCESLAQVNIPDSIVSIDAEAFYGCSKITSVTFPQTLEKIGREAFLKCKSLQSVVIPRSVTSIGEGAFRWCEGLRTVRILAPVSSIGENTFDGCFSMESITLPGTVTSLGDYAFNGCHNLAAIEIPEAVTSIGMGAFSFCDGLASLHIPRAVESIGAEALSGCSGLKSITVEPGNPVYDSRDNCNAIIKTAANRLLFGCGATVIPNTVREIGERAFNWCGSLVSIDVPSSVTEIDAFAFYRCQKMVSIHLSDSVRSIGMDAFYGCVSLKSFHLPKSATDVAHNLFSECPSLTTITVDPENPVYDSRNNCNAIIQTATNTPACTCRGTVLPDGVSKW